MLRMSPAICFFCFQTVFLQHILLLLSLSLSLSGCLSLSLSVFSLSLFLSVSLCLSISPFLSVSPSLCFYFCPFYVSLFLIAFSLFAYCFLFLYLFLSISFSLSLFLTCGTDVIEKGIVVLGPDEAAGKDNCVEGNVVLSHELIKLDLQTNKQTLPCTKCICGAGDMG